MKYPVQSAMLIGMQPMKTLRMPFFETKRSQSIYNIAKKKKTQ